MADCARAEGSATTFCPMDKGDAFSVPPRKGLLVGRVVAGARRRARGRIRRMFTSRGPGFRRLAEAHAGAVAGDTLLAMALAGTLFFDVPSTEARDNVALYLLVTLAPFSVIGPFLGAVYERFPGAYRGGMVVSCALRAAVAPIMAIGLDTFLLFPLAFVMLVLSRLFGISRSSFLPVVLTGPRDLITANAQLARIGIFASALAVPIGALGIWALDPWVALVVAAIIFVWAAVKVAGLPALDATTSAALVEESRSARASAAGYRGPPRRVRLARFATAGVRFLNGFLLLLVAFAFRDADAGVYDFGALLGSAGAGFFLAALLTPVLNRHMSEEPMVVAGLAVEAGAAFIAAQAFSLGAAAALSAAAGFAWGTAKFGFDGLLQATVPARARGRAFAGSETFFQFAWVIGALIAIVPGSSVGIFSLPTFPVEAGLIVAGIVALSIQVVYVSAVLVPAAADLRQSPTPREPEQHGDVMDLLG